MRKKSNQLTNIMTSPVSPSPKMAFENLFQNATGLAQKQVALACRQCFKSLQKTTKTPIPVEIQRRTFEKISPKYVALALAAGPLEMANELFGNIPYSDSQLILQCYGEMEKGVQTTLEIFPQVASSDKVNALILDGALYNAFFCALNEQLGSLPKEMWNHLVQQEKWQPI